MLQLGALQVYLLSDGVVQVDAGGMFGLVPRALWGRMVAPDAENRVPMHLRCLLVKVGDQNIVIDTGLGNKLDEKHRRQWGLERPQGDLLAGLARAGVAPAAVTLVINTHLHADHCAGNNFFDAAGALRPTFPQARYVVQRREYEDAMRPNERTRATYIPLNYEPLHLSGQLELLEGDTELAPGVRGVVTPGHTPGHMSVVLEGGGQAAVFLCDLATYLVHFEKLGWMTAYDVEPLITLETKRAWQQWAMQHHAYLISAHDPQPVARLRPDEHGTARIIPVDLAQD
ncbi:MAG: MBL fold metallo-hydrolase [Anaerolineae bacterium]|nr:MBL fold metallo-hydrolase [Anaerolineae bacterium]